MKGNSVLSMSGLSRRAALRHAAALGAVIGLGGGLRRVAAQDSATEMANHPMVGTWLGGRTPDSLGTTRFGPDGSMTNTAGVIGQTPEGALALNSLDPESGSQSAPAGSTSRSLRRTTTRRGRSSARLPSTGTRSPAKTASPSGMTARTSPSPSATRAGR
jgi:hypothetical protein